MMMILKINNWSSPLFRSNNLILLSWLVM